MWLPHHPTSSTHASPNAHSQDHTHAAPAPPPPTHTGDIEGRVSEMYVCGRRQPCGVWEMKTMDLGVIISNVLKCTKAKLLFIKQTSVRIHCKISSLQNIRHNTDPIQLGCKTYLEYTTQFWSQNYQEAQHRLWESPNKDSRIITKNKR